VPRSVFDRLGGYNTALSSAEDYELWLRIAVRGYPVLRTPGRLAIYRKRPGSISTQERLMLLGLVEAYNLVASDERVPPVLRDRAKKLRLNAERSLAILDGERGSALFPELVRRSVQRLKQRVGNRLLQTRAIPPEVQAAFPDLHGI